MRATTLVLLLSLFFFLAVSSYASIISNGYFNGRSAEHVIVPKNVNEMKSDSVMVLKSANAYKSDSIKDTDVADLASHVLGAGALNGLSGDHDRSAYPEVDVFAPAQANIFVSIDYVGAESAQSELKSVGQSIAVTKSSYPMSPISFLTTLVTGTTPAVHGIVASFWKEFDDVYTAYSSEGQSMIGNFADFLSQSTQGKSAVVSISADEQQSKALCSHLLNVAREPLSNNFCYTWDFYSNNVKSIASPSEKLSLLTRQQIWLAFTQKDSTLNKILASAGITVVVDNAARSRLSLVSGEVASEFELATQEDAAFSAELSMVADLIARLRLGAYNSLIQDSAQDHFSIAISTLRTIAAKYGEDSTHFTVALKAVDAVIKTLIQEIEKAYDNKVATEIVFMGKQTLELPSSLNGIVEPQYLPQIVPFSSKTEEEAVQAVEKALENTQFEVVEQEVSEITYFRTKRAAESSSSPMDLLTITPSQLASFQICLWTPIILTIVVLAITISMISMGSSATSGKEANVFNAPRSGAAQ